MTSVFAQTTPLAARQQQRERIAAKHGAGMLPIVLEAYGKNAKVNFTALPPTATVADLQRAVREIGDVSRRSACALTVDGCTPSSTTTLADLYAACSNAQDGFLYVQFAGEKTLGCMLMSGGGESGGSGQTSLPGLTGGAGSGGSLINDNPGLITDTGSQNINDFLNQQNPA